MVTTNGTAMPGEHAPRIQQLDVIRGIAVLGIFLLNIVALGLPAAVSDNPVAMGPVSSADLWVWGLSQVFAEQKFIAMFGMLFGAGILLFAERAEARQLAPRALHFRRMGWLALFGLLHAWLFWYGDILFPYAVAGCLAWLWRAKPVASLIRWGVALYLIPALLLYLVHLSLPQMDPADLADLAAFWTPEAEQLAAEIAALQGGLAERVAYQREFILSQQTGGLLFGTLWLVLGYMLLGMALFKLGVLSLQVPRTTYYKLLGWLLPGLALSTHGVYYQVEAEFSALVSFAGPLWNYLGSLMTALGYIGILGLVALRITDAGWMQRVKAVGRMAFSAYIMQTLIGVILFQYIGLFGLLQRSHLILIVMLVWAVQLVVLPLYLQHFRQGPLEWVWRRLTYAGTRRVDTSV
ncbi:hypothetical protein CWE12_03230 [Aliidiomarina sedimenti]|uniref:DUF418 domain-containing protein n=1 Tax=Aliidiomarina sedimenti TaxID=1933879 RepID=A0ABY0C2W4_9GAMM|nr:DUF418 domain-containing protein [Aliidiomarina sedimenti]RUO32014.1 hypothetical protein CWE12_03230 [Aliidiomarina sedimenti]